MAPPGTPSESWPTILLVDDNVDVSGAYTAVLETLGYRVLCARDGAEAVRLGRAHRDEIALVLTDLAMPGMSGAEVVQALRREGVRAPVVVMSGYAQPAEAASGALGDVAAWLVKPLDVDELARAVEDALSPRPTA